MSIQQNASVLTPPPALAKPQVRKNAGREASVAGEAALLRLLPRKNPIHVAGTPLTLDVIGGLTDCSGGLLLFYPLTDAVSVAVEAANDAAVHITVISSSKAGEPVVLGHPSTNGHAQHEASTADQTAIAKLTCPFARAAAASIAEAVADRLIEPVGLHVAIQMENDVHGESGCTAVAAAVLTAVSRLQQQTPTTEHIVSLIRRAEMRCGRNAPGLEAFSSILAQSNALLPVCARDVAPQAPISLPHGVRVIGVDSGQVTADAADKYMQARVAAYMGRKLIARIVAHESSTSQSKDHCLSQISVEEYTNRFRDRLPTKLAGRYFVDHFGPSDDPHTHIEPSRIYKVRSRTEHHIYENARVKAFVKCIERAVRSPDDAPLIEAGELLNASHWSYGQRCGLGATHCDTLVRLIRKQGVDAGVFGARVTGRGCGGIVAVLLRDDEQASEAMKRALDEYHKKSGFHARLLEGTSAGSGSALG